ncbi:MAG: hypothetical protein Q6373_006210 [Candidatus Sigynarchaeota archaeon]
MKPISALLLLLRALLFLLQRREKDRLFFRIEKHATSNQQPV